MKSTYKKIEQNRILKLKREYTKNGFTVVIQPSINQLPAFLRSLNYRPDLIAKSNKMNFIIEVKSSETISESKQLKSVAEVIKKHNKWEFLFVVTNPKKTIEDKPKFSFDFTAKAMKKVGSLYDRDDNQDFFDIILFYSWSIIQSLLKELIVNYNKKTTTFSPRSLIREGVTNGVLSKRDYELLVELFNKRNLIAHGDLTVSIKNNEILSIRRITRSLFNELKVNHSESNNYIINLRTLGEKELEYEIENLISDSIYEIVESEEVSSRIAETNSFAYGIDTFDIDDITINDDECYVELYYSAHGETSEDHPFCGSKITGKAKATIDINGEVIYQVMSAEIDDF